MKNLLTLILLVFVVLATSSCHKETQQEQVSHDTIPEIKTPPNNEQGVYVDSTLLTHGVKHAFSDPNRLDSFALVVKGKSLLDAQVTFSIKNADGTVLYTQTFPTNYLLGYGLEGIANPTAKQQEEYIRTRIETFFEEKDFYPNPLKNASYEKDYSDKATWEEIKADPTAIGFSYLIGKEDGRRIAYSKKKKEVVLYYNCC